jgi:hypothetical protein
MAWDWEILFANVKQNCSSRTEYGRKVDGHVQSDAQMLTNSENKRQDPDPQTGSLPGEPRASGVEEIESRTTTEARKDCEFMDRMESPVASDAGGMNGRRGLCQRPR